MNSTKILFTDLDGTLLNDERNISYQNKQAIHKALENNHKVVIATGRPLPSALILMEELGLTNEGCYAITYNGGLIYDCGAKKAIAKSTIPMEYVHHIFQIAKEQGIHCHTYTDKYVISEQLTTELERYCNNIRIPYKIIDNMQQADIENPVKAIMIDFGGKERLAKVKEELNSWCDGKVNSYFSNPYLLEFGSLEATKGNAVKFLCNHLHIPIEHSIAAGDEENDISMLQAAGIGTVMANASDEIKKYGDYITKNNNNNHGIAEIIERFLL
jgi:Cof subfamily protein (haloacid dehalogenase superfamily)